MKKRFTSRVSLLLLESPFPKMRGLTKLSTAVEEKMVLQYNKFLKGGSSGSDYAQVLVRLLRMRQATLHPALVTKASIETDADALDPTLKNDDDPNTPKKVQAAGMTPSCTVCGNPTRSKDDEYCSTCAVDFDRVKTLQSSTKVTKTMQLLQQFRNETKGLDEDGKKIPKKKVIIFSQVSLYMFRFSPA